MAALLKRKDSAVRPSRRFCLGAVRLAVKERLLAKHRSAALHFGVVFPRAIVRRIILGQVGPRCSFCSRYSRLLQRMVRRREMSTALSAMVLVDCPAVGLLERLHQRVGIVDACVSARAARRSANFGRVRGETVHQRDWCVPISREDQARPLAAAGGERRSVGEAHIRAVSEAAARPTLPCRAPNGQRRRATRQWKSRWRASHRIFETADDIQGFVQVTSSGALCQFQPSGEKA